MMKRTAALVLAAALAASLVLPAAAADESTQDARLAQVTQAVKDTLDLDTSEYSSFYGECYDQTLVSQWSLYWEGSTGTLSIDALEDGTITGYYLSQEEAGSAGLPSYPSGDPPRPRRPPRPFCPKCSPPAWSPSSWRSPPALTAWDGTSTASPATSSFTACPPP